MSRPLIELIVELFRDHVDDPAPVATADYIDASVNYEELDYEPYMFRLHFIPRPDSVLVTSVERHPTQKEAPVLAAMFSKFHRPVQHDQHVAHTLARRTHTGTALT
jgi:hypothetical protein